ncbi:MAG: hypothetical protein R3C30_11380 [Hyphomonadaceae bacterium]
MKDLVTVLFVLVLGAGVAGGFFYWKGEQAREADRAYELVIDQAFDRSVESFQLQSLLTSVSVHEGEARLTALREAYANSEQGDYRDYDRINLGFGNLEGDWPTTYSSIADPAGRQTERGRFAAEVDERFGAGAHAFMRAEYERFLAELPQRMADRQAAQERETQVMIRALDIYRRQHGRYPERGFRVVDGRIVEQ